MLKLKLISYLLCLLSVARCLENGWELPLLPSTFPSSETITFRYNNNATSTGNKSSIPNFVWIAFSQAPEDIHVDLHTYFMIRNNPSWKFYFAGNEEKQRFIDTVFNGTSVQWAYNIINEKLGNSKAGMKLTKFYFLHSFSAGHYIQICGASAYCTSLEEYI